MNKERLIAASGSETNELPHRGIELNIHSMDYSFMLIDVFEMRPDREKMFDHFEGEILRLISVYIKRWIMEKKNPDKKERERDLDAVFDFQSNIKLKEAFNRIFDGHDVAGIFIPVSNATLAMKRFGNCLGIKLKSNNGGDEIHENGTKLLEVLCHENHPYFAEFIHSIECIIPLPGKSEKNNSWVVDFSDIHQSFAEACPYFNPLLHPDQLTQNLIRKYKMIYAEEKEVSVGSWRNGTGIVICFKIIHYGEDKNSHKFSPQWRKGNVEDLGEGRVLFSDKHDLCLSVSVNGPFPKTTFLKEFDPNMKVDEQQRAMLTAGEILYKQLCAMLANKNSV